MFKRFSVPLAVGALLVWASAGPVVVAQSPATPVAAPQSGVISGALRLQVDLPLAGGTVSLPFAVSGWLVPWMLEGGRCGGVVAHIGSDDVASYKRLIITVRCRA